MLINTLFSESDIQQDFIASINEAVLEDKCETITSALSLGGTKKNYCKFCFKPQSKISRHIEQMHFNEPEVKPLLTSLKNECKERRRIQEKIRREGNFVHNQKVLTQKSGKIVPAKRLAMGVEAENYVPCIYCKSFFLKEHLWIHHNRCFLFEKSSPSGKRVQMEAKMMLLNTTSLQKLFVQKVLKDCSPDNVTDVIMSDALILKFGQSSFRRLRKQHNANLVRQKMRECARLLLVARSRSADVTTFESLLQPNMFDIVKESVDELCNFDEETGSFEITNLPLKLGHHMRNCADILTNIGIKTYDAGMQQNAMCFLQLMNTEYTETSSVALKSMETKKFNKPKYSPVAKDVKKLTIFLRDNIRRCMSKIGEELTEATYKELAEYTMLSIILFNRRRSGEVERITLKDYMNGQAAGLSVDVEEDLGEIEKILIKNLKRIVIPGKKGRGVPVLLRKIHIDAINLMLSSRIRVGISDDCPHLFARPRGGSTPINACATMRKVTNAAGLECPDYIRSTALRKHVATLSQLVHLSESELEQLANFLGHDLSVHRDFYRLPDDVSQIIKVGKLLIAAEEGKFSRQKKMNLSDIIVNEEEVIGEGFFEEDAVPDGFNELESQEFITATDVSNGLRKNDVSSNSMSSNMTVSKTEKRKWSEVHKNLARQEFKELIRQKKLPGKKDCQAFLEKNGILERKWTNVKDMVRCQLKKQDLVE